MYDQNEKCGKFNLLFPLIATIDARDEQCHRFISTASLHLIVSAFFASASATSVTIGRSLNFWLEHVFIASIFLVNKNFPFFGFDILVCHECQLLR